MPDIDEEESAARCFLKALGLSVDLFEHRDKPDFLIHYDGEKIGLEVCSGTPEELHRAMKSLDNKQKSGCLYPGSLQHRASHKERRPTTELTDELTEFSGQWQDHQESHERWKLGIITRLIEKERSFNNPGFRRFDQNWLLIDDRDVPHIAHTVDIHHVKRHLKEIGEIFQPDDYFDKVWINFGHPGGLIEWTISVKDMVWRGLPTGDIIF